MDNELIQIQELLNTALAEEDWELVQEAIINLNALLSDDNSFHSDDWDSF